MATSTFRIAMDFVRLLSAIAICCTVLVHLNSTVGNRKFMLTNSTDNSNIEKFNNISSTTNNRNNDDDDVASFLRTLRQDVTAVVVQERRRRASKECNVNCSRAKARAVCATDRQIYVHKCELKRIRRCEGRRVRAIPMGFCTGHFVLATETKCLQKRREALSQNLQTAIGSYIPQCTEEGDFQDVQCHIETGYCWCVTSEGDAVPGTSRHGASVNKLTCRGSSKICTPQDRTEFNENLVKLFKTEFKMTTQSDEKTTRKTIAHWKFKQLDVNQDEVLRRKEIRVLKRMVKKIVRPKSCAKTFDSYCDLDGDTKVTFTEWILCLGIKKKKISSQTETSQSQSQNTQRNSDAPTDSSETMDTGVLTSVSDFDAMGDSYDAIDPYASTFLRDSTQNQENTNAKETPTTDLDQESLLMESDDGVLDCASERQMALELDDLEPQSHVFIPECLDNGQYAPAQCHTSTGYCWCVDDVTGRPILGTSTNGVKPDCHNNTARRQPRRHPDEGTEFLTFPVPS